MADERHALTRRAAIRSTALAAGLVWTAPSVKTIRVLGAPGTPAPPTSGTAPPTFTTYRFGGPFEADFVVFGGVPGCAVTGDFNVDTAVDGVGSATVAFDVCVEQIPPPGGTNPLSGTFTLTATDGTLQGTFVGIGEYPVVGATAHYDMTIASGTGIFADATGSATLDATLVSLPFHSEGTLAGIADVLT